MHEETNKKDYKKWEGSNHASGGAVYGLGLVGAAIYYIQQADGFGAGVVAILKALVWPAFVVYEWLSFLG
jgi:hypothetical protein